jgi:hypothetical protein
MLSAAFGISCVHDVCEYIQTYSQACPWLFTWPGQEFYEDYLSDVRAEPRIAATRIGIIRVSCSCGNGAPSTLEDHKPIPSSTTRYHFVLIRPLWSPDINVVSLDLYGRVSISCKCLVICNKDVSTSNRNPGLVMT